MLWILLPAYNESIALPGLLKSIRENLRNEEHRIILVDDGSTDETAEIARDLSCEVLIHPRNQGLGQAMQTGLSHILPRAKIEDILVTLDADGTHPADRIPKLCEAIRRGADIAISSRFTEGGEEVGVSLLRRLLSRIAGFLIRSLSVLRGVRDATCNFRAYKMEILKKATEKNGLILTEKGFAASLELLLAAAAFTQKIQEVPFVLRYDLKSTKSRMPIFKTILRTFMVLYKHTGRHVG